MANRKFKEPVRLAEMTRNLRDGIQPKTAGKDETPAASSKQPTKSSPSDSRERLVTIKVRESTHTRLKIAAAKRRMTIVQLIEEHLASLLYGDEE